MLANDEFKEADHPRDDSGRFTDKSGSSSGSVEHKGAKIDIKKDGKYADVRIYAPEGKKFKNGDTFYTTEAEADKAEELAKKIIDNEFGGEGTEKKEESSKEEKQQEKTKTITSKRFVDIFPVITQRGNIEWVSHIDEDTHAYYSTGKYAPSQKGTVSIYKRGDDGHGHSIMKKVFSTKSYNELKKYLEENGEGWRFDDDFVGDKTIEDESYSEAQLDKIGIVMKEFKDGELKSSSGEKVTDPKQAKAIALSEADKLVKDKEIPEKAGKPEKAGDEVALNQGETKMAEEVKEAPAEKKVEETKKEEVVEDACKKAEDKKEVKPACDEKEDKRKLIDEIGGILKGKLDDELLRTVLKKAEELAYNDSERSADDEKKDDLKGKEKEAFAEGVDFGEKKEKAEPKKLDSEHESEGMKKAEEKAEKKEMAKDEGLTMDIDAIKAQVREEVMADFKAREEARKAVRGFVGDVNVMAFDSAEDIYKFACGKSGMDLNEIVSFKDAFKGLSAGKSKALALDASPVSGSNEECLKDIRIA